MVATALVKKRFINPVTDLVPTIDMIRSEYNSYPSSAGKPIAEGDFQRIQLTYGIDSLSFHFKAALDIYVSGNLFIYYEEGNPSAVIAPDVFVVFGVEKKRRRSYKVWEEGGKLPDFVLEITSKSTAAQDRGAKMGLYAYLGVREYFMFDPTSDYLDPPLQGMKLNGNGYWDPLDTKTLPDGTLVVFSEVLQLELHASPAGELHFYDPKTEKFLRNYVEANTIADEAILRAEQEAQRAERERQARLESEARLAKLEARLRDLGLE